MNAATRWLMKANARAVVLGLIAALCLTAAWWTYKEFAPRDASLPKVKKSSKVSRVKAVDLGLMAALDARRSYALMEIPGNPFMSSDKAWTYTPGRTERPIEPPAPAQLLKNILSGGPRPPWKPRPRPAKPPRTGPPAAPPATAPEVVEPEVVEPEVVEPQVVEPEVAEPAVAAAPGKPREVVHLTYRGVFRRSDGRVLALIHDSKSGGAAFYPVGADVFGVTVININNAEAGVIQANGEAASLNIGEESPFEEGIHAD